MVRLSALCTGRLYPQGNFPGINFFLGRIDPRAIVRPEGLISFCSLSYDRSVASSKASSPQGAIYLFLFQFPVSSLFLKVIQ
jgi:hypothetical protein